MPKKLIYIFLNEDINYLTKSQNNNLILNDKALYVLESKILNINIIINISHFIFDIDEIYLILNGDDKYNIITDYNPSKYFIVSDKRKLMKKYKTFELYFNNNIHFKPEFLKEIGLNENRLKFNLTKNIKIDYEKDVDNKDINEMINEKVEEIIDKNVDERIDETIIDISYDTNDEINYNTDDENDDETNIDKDIDENIDETNVNKTNIEYVINKYNQELEQLKNENINLKKQILDKIKHNIESLRNENEILKNKLKELD